MCISLRQAWKISVISSLIRYTTELPRKLVWKNNGVGCVRLLAPLLIQLRFMVYRSSCSGGRIVVNGAPDAVLLPVHHRMSERVWRLWNRGNLEKYQYILRSSHCYLSAWGWLIRMRPSYSVLSLPSSNPFRIIPRIAAPFMFSSILFLWIMLLPPGNVTD